MPAATENAALTDLSHLGLLKVSGDGAKKLLQGQLTCDLEEISPLQSRLGAYCTPQGRMLSLFRLFQYDNDYYLQMSADTVAETITTLKKYAVFFKVSLTDASTTFTRLSVHGDSVAGLLSTFGNLPETVDSAVLAGDVLIIKLPGTLPHYELIAPPTALATLSVNAKQAENTWKSLNITAGIPDLNAATKGKFLPHEINLPALNGVSFNKGCYTGQEIVARMHYRGQMKKGLHLGKIALPAQPGADIYDDKGPAGTIVDCSQADGESLILFIADKNAIETRQLYADFAKIVPIELMSLPE